MIDWIKGDYETTERDIGSVNCKNCFVIKQGDGATVSQILKGVAGMKPWINLDEAVGKCRGSFVSATGDAYVAYNNRLYKIDTLGNQVLVSVSLAGGTINPVRFAESMFYLMFVDSVRMYAYEYATGTLSIVASAPPAPTDIVWFGGRMLASNRTNQVFYSASPVDALDDTHVKKWGILDGGGWIVASQSADNVNALGVAGGYLHILGDRSHEAWQANYTSLTTPYTLINSTVSTLGSISVAGVTTVGDAVFLVGSLFGGTPSLFMIQGSSVTKVGTPAMDDTITEMYSNGKNLRDAKLFTISQFGTTFIYMTSQTCNICWGYDVTSQMFHTRLSYHPSKKLRWNIDEALQIQEKAYVCGINGTLYELSSTSNKDGDDPLVFEYTGPVQLDDLNKFVMKTCEFFMHTGSGIDGDVMGNPKMVVESSRQGGRQGTFDYSRIISIGKLGEYDKYVAVHNFGYGRSHVIRIRISDDVKREVYGLKVTI